MALIVSGNSPPLIHLHSNTISLHFSSIPHFPYYHYHRKASHLPRLFFALKSGSDSDGCTTGSSSSKDAYGAEEGFVNWEDQIFENTAPLVGFVRMILHSDKYRSGERLSPKHERVILERLLPYHPAYKKKIGSGVDYITVGYHPDFESSRCLFIVRKDGELVDFSYWKCIKSFIRQNYPRYAHTFILKHFRQHRKD